MTSPTEPANALDDLRVRVEGLSGPDRDVDEAIEDWRVRSELDATGKTTVSFVTKRYTASLDAVLALVAVKLPGAGWDLSDRTPDGCCAKVWPVDGPIAFGTAKTPALALLSALLAALPTPEGSSND